ncbi:MAG: HEAT repeat domain-containing protein [Ruminococcus sp.]|nr:HEAT repeat domain-containing protein [Ruminococcus sp.]
MKSYEQMCKEEKLALLEQEMPAPEILIAMMHDSDEDVRLFLAEYLCEVYTPLSERLLLMLMDDPSVQVRIAACDSVCWCSSETVFEKILEKSVHDAFLVRGYAVLSAADVLLNQEEQKQLHMGTAILEQNDQREKSVWVKICYAQSLYRLGNSDALYRLISYLNVSRYNYRCCVINALMDVADEKNQAQIRLAFKKRLAVETNQMLIRKLTECMDLL